MIRGILFFLFVWSLVSFGIIAFDRTNTETKKLMLKSLLYGAVTALIACGLLFLIVVSF